MLQARAVVKSPFVMDIMMVGSHDSVGTDCTKKNRQKKLPIFWCSFVHPCILFFLSLFLFYYLSYYLEGGILVLGIVVEI